MLRLELTEREAVTLRQVIEDTISDLRMEIADTDQKDFRDQLKLRKDALQMTLHRLRVAAEELPGAGL